MGSGEKMPVAFQQEIIKLRWGLIKPLVDRSGSGHNRGIITEKNAWSVFGDKIVVPLRKLSTTFTKGN